MHIGSRPWPGLRSRRGLFLATVTVTVAVTFFSPLAPRAQPAVPASDRAWELVTFGQPSSAQVFAMNPLGESGERLVYQTIGPPPGAQSGSFFASSTAVRGLTGWLNTPVGIPYSAYTTELFALLVPVVATAFSEDLQTSLWLTSVPVTPDGPSEGQLGLYRRVGNGSPQFIAEVGEGLTFGYPGFADISRDGTRVVFTTAEHLLPEDAGRTQGESIYEWDAAGLRLVDTSSDGTLLSACGSQIPPANGMSASADRVYFTHPVQAACGGTKRAYLHDSEADTTIEISASRCTRADCNIPQDVTFAGATPDGSSAFIVTPQQLTNDDLDTGRDLYRYEVSSDELSLLSGGSPEADGQVNQGIVYPSDDGTRVYFRATGAMLPGEADIGEKLYLVDESGIHLVAVAAFPPEPQIQLSQSGRTALFVSASKVVEDDADTQQDTYLYDANQEAVTRVSTGPSGGNGAFDANITSPLRFPEFEYGNDHVFYGIDASGERAFFTTAETLVLADVNSKLDVYEWKDGQVRLVTPGIGDIDDEFAGVSRDGRTLMFGTSATLSSTDQDGGDTDLYAARLGGGFPEAEQPPNCDSALCPRPMRDPLLRPSPGSATDRGARSLKRIRVLGIRSRDAGSAIGRETLVFVSVPVPGLVVASVWARKAGEKVVLARGRAGAIRPGRIRVRLRLTGAGRRANSMGIRKGRLSVREGALETSRVVSVNAGSDVNPGGDK
jgi:hypothetical protein